SEENAMRHWSYPCLIALGMLCPRLCLAQAASEEARQEREMQEDVEVLRRIVTESVHELYRQAEERVTKSCVSCHTLVSSRNLVEPKGISRGRLPTMGEAM